MRRGLSKAGWLMLVLGLFGPWAAAADPCALVARWNPEPPLYIVGPEGAPTGITVDILDQALGRIGCTVHFEQIPWARALEKLQKGQIDILTGAYKTAEREQFALFSQPVITGPNILFIRKDDIGKWPIQALTQIKDGRFRLGVQIDVMYSAEYQTLPQDDDFRRHLVPVGSRDSLWRMLEKGRIDGVIADATTGRYEIAQLGFAERIDSHGLTVSRDQSFYAFSRKTVDPARVADFDAAITAMRRDGSFDAILRRYHVN